MVKLFNILGLCKSIMESDDGGILYFTYSRAAQKRRKKEKEELSESYDEVANEIKSHKGKNTKNHVSLLKARNSCNTPKAQLKKEKTLRDKEALDWEDDVDDLKEEKEISLDSKIIELPLRYYANKLNKNTPLTWDIYPEDNKIHITIGADLEAIAGKENIEDTVIETLKENKVFRDFVREVQSFLPEDSHIKDLYTLSKYTVKEGKSSIEYSLVLEL